jgi:hypothetical protein
MRRIGDALTQPQHPCHMQCVEIISCSAGKRARWSSTLVERWRACLTYAAVIGGLHAVSNPCRR